MAEVKKKPKARTESLSREEMAGVLKALQYGMSTTPVGGVCHDTPEGVACSFPRGDEHAAFTVVVPDTFKVEVA